MAQALALAATELRTAPAAEWLRRGVVCGCALALIMAGQALPGL
jgi:hypothetical protein